MQPNGPLLRQPSTGEPPLTGILGPHQANPVDSQHLDALKNSHGPVAKSACLLRIDHQQVAWGDAWQGQGPTVRSASLCS